MNTLSVTIVQANLRWEDKQANLQHFDKLLNKVDETDIIVLPEMFSTGFSMNPKELYDNSPSDKTLDWMKKLSRSKNAGVCGSIIVMEEDKYYNRLYFVQPDGNVESYDKRHLFTLAGEEKVYTPGNKHLLVNFRGWKIMPLVCYDLRFPVWCRNTSEADLQIFVANWPERRNEAWKTLLRARAIENMCYLAGVNRVGEDGNGVIHSGDSVVYNELGESILATTAHQEAVETVLLDRETMLASRSRFSFLNDRDSFRIID